MPETKTVDIRGYSQKQLEGLDLDVLRGMCQDRHLPIKPQAHRKTCVARLLEHLTATSAVTVSTASTAQSDAQAKQLSPSDKDQNIASSAVAAHAEPHVDVKHTSSTSDKDSTCSLWYEDKKHSYPPSHTGGSYGFTAKTLVTPKKMLPDGTVEWCDPHTGAKRVYSTSEWNERTAKWEQMYPSLYPTKEPHPHENTSQRGTACSAERRNCWDRLSQTNSDIPSNFANEYRVDQYGNVVCISASQDALCYFNVDHNFPFSRGGQSKLDNFSAVQWAANMHVKGNRLIPTLCTEQMQCGLSAQQFKALDEHCKHMACGRTRSFGYKHHRDIVKHWLTHNPLSGHTLGKDFQTKLKQHADEREGGVINGATLWSFFVRYIGVPTPECQGSEKAALSLVSVRAPSSPTELLCCPPPAPQLNMHLTQLDDGKYRVDVYGPNTFPVKEDLKQRFRAKWNAEPKSWFFIIEAGNKTATLEAANIMANEKGLQLLVQ